MKAERPKMPPSCGVGDARYGFEPVSWDWIRGRMESARNYWIATVAADGNPRASPVWGVWADGGFHFFTDADSLKARNLARNPRAVVHTESGDDVAILEGTMERVQPSAAVVRAYEAKYGVTLGDRPAAAYRLRIVKALAWQESDFPKTATRRRFG